MAADGVEEAPPTQRERRVSRQGAGEEATINVRTTCTYSVDVSVLCIVHVHCIRICTVYSTYMYMYTVYISLPPSLPPSSLPLSLPSSLLPPSSLPSSLPPSSGTPTPREGGREGGREREREGGVQVCTMLALQLMKPPLVAHALLVLWC